MATIARYLIDRPLLTNVLLILIAVLTVASVTRIKRTGYPRVDLGKMNITTVFPGAGPEDVELNVTVRLEEALKGVSGIDRFVSRSMENVSFIQVFIDADAEDPEKVKDEIRRAIESVTDLPEEVEKRPNILEIKTDYQPAYETAIVMPGADDKLLRTHARRLKKKLEDLAIVSQVNETGVREREIRILLDRRKMNRRAVTFDEVIRSVKLNKLRVSGGSLESYTSEKGIVTLSEFSTPRDVENIIIRSNFLGNRIRIKDVGRVVDGFSKRDTIVRYDGQPGVSLWVRKKSGADVIQAVTEIKKVIARYKKELAPAEMKFLSTWDDSIETKNRLSILYGNAAAGLVLVLVVLFLFLDRRIAFWTAAGIPLSVGLTIITLPMLGITINSISILGMVVVLGMVVDDAIIIAESIYRAREEGLGAREAALTGLQAVIKPVLGTIITTMIAFFPMYFIPGIVGDFAVEIPTIVIVMLAASFIEATTILPAHLAHESPRAKSGDAKDASAARKTPPGKKLLTLLENFYARILTWSVRHRYLTSLFFLGFLLLGGGLGYLITNVNMFPSDQAYRIWIRGELPRGTSLEHTHKRAMILEGLIRDLPKGVVHSYKTIVGVLYDPSTDSSYNTSDGFLVNLILVPATNRNLTAHDVRDRLVAALKTKAPDIKPGFTIQGGGPPVGQPLEIQINGQDEAKRRELMAGIRADLKALHVIDVATDYRLGKEELRLLPDYEVIARAGLNVSTIASTIRTAYDGTIVTYLQTPDERVPFRVSLDRDKNDFSKPLDSLFVRNSAGNRIPIKRLVRRKASRSPEAFYHYNGYRTNRITGNIDTKKTTTEKVYAALKKKYADFERRNPGFKVILGGEGEKSAAFQRHMAIALGIAVLTIYLLLVLQFNSFTQPAMVILAIPFGLVGILVAFGVHRMDLSMLALIGILGFTGVVVNDSLIMVDFINRLQGDSDQSDVDSADFRAAVIKGAGMRLRPIVLTTVTTVAGLVPTAYGIIGGTDSFVSPMVMAMTWGLLVGTMSVLVVIPVLYCVHRDSMNFLARLFRRR